MADYTIVTIPLHPPIPSCSLFSYALNFLTGSTPIFGLSQGAGNQSIAVIPYFMQKLHISPEFVSLLTVDIVNKPHWKRTPERSGSKSCYYSYINEIY
jgi:hypothetical protein